MKFNKFLLHFYFCCLSQLLLKIIDDMLPIRIKLNADGKKKKLKIVDYAVGNLLKVILFS